jgi:hypothetical protein
VRRRIAVARRAFAPVLLCGLAALACAKGKERSDSAAAVAARPAALLGASPSSFAPANLPGMLAQPLDSLSGEELYLFTRTLTFGGGADRERRCKGSPDCQSASPIKTTVRVDAVDGQDSLSAISLPANGVVAVKAINKGLHADEMYGMRPGMATEYFLVVLPGTDSTGRWRLEELDTTPGARRHAQVASGTLKPCWHGFVQGKVNRANFYTCYDSHMSADSVTRSGLALQPGSDAPLWMDCAQGCCVATQP